MMSEKLVVEYAKSNRAACKLCGANMAKESVRVGTITKAAGFDRTHWHHPSCFMKRHFKGDLASISEINGFKSLKAVDQDDLKKLAAESENTSLETTPKKLKIEHDGAGSSNQVSMASLINFSHSQLAKKYKDAELPDGWKAFSTVILYEAEDLLARDKIAAFDFDGCLAKTSVQRHGADAWSLLYPSIPKKLQDYHDDGYKLVIITNESTIDRWKNSRQKAIDSKIGRLEGFMKLVNAPMQVFISCAKDGSDDLYRKPKDGIWVLLEKHFNNSIHIDKTRSFFVGDAAGRPGDHSDADLGFARAIGLKFFLPEDVFLEAKPKKTSSNK